MPNGMKFHPNRGIGLGYYEDLKTIGVMAILLDYKVLSLYGDQGIIEDAFHVDEKLREHNFIIKPSKVKMLPLDRVFWGGWTYTAHSYSIPKRFSNAFLGAFFSRQHWERKLALRGLYSEHKSRYIRIEKRISFLYELFFGYEFYKGESSNNFYDCGVSATQPLISGNHKLYRVQDKVAPNSQLPIDFKFFIPTVVSRDRTIPDSLAKEFSILRKKIFKRSPVMDDSVYRYSRPRIVYNNQKVKLNSPLPGWADALYASLYGSSTGVIAFGLSPEELILAARRQVYAKNPFEARSKGGYSVLTKYRGLHCPTEEAMETAYLLSQLETRELPYANRADLYPSVSQGEDPMYYDSALVEREHFSLKRKNRQAFSEYSGLSDQEYRDLIYKKVKDLAGGTDNALVRLNSLLRTENFDIEMIDAQSTISHGLEEEEDYYDEDYLDEVINNFDF